MRYNNLIGQKEILLVDQPLQLEGIPSVDEA
jgi:hypothetical protein